MRLAIVAAPSPASSVALTLLSVLTLELALSPPAVRPRHDAGGPPGDGCWAVAPDPRPEPTCATAHALVVRGHVAGGASHVQLAGPVLYTDVATDPSGDFTLRVPVDGDVCDLLAQPTSYIFGEDVSYTIAFE